MVQLSQSTGSIMDRYVASVISPSCPRGFLVVSSAPSSLMSMREMSRIVGHSPYMIDAPERVPVVHGLWLLKSLSPVWLFLALFGVVVVVLAGVLLNAGAVRALARPLKKSPRNPVKAVIAILRGGAVHVSIVARILVLELCVLAVGVGVIVWLGQQWISYGEGAGWTGRTIVGGGLSVQGGGVVMWGALVGALGHWCRIVAVMDRRTRLFATVWCVLKVWRGSLMRGPVLFLGLTISIQCASGALLLIWRQWPPSGVLGLGVVFVVWMGVLVAQATAWCWLIHNGVALYGAVTGRRSV